MLCSDVRGLRRADAGCRQRRAVPVNARFVLPQQKHGQDPQDLQHPAPQILHPTAREGSEECGHKRPTFVTLLIILCILLFDDAA